jgi:hypothetical protein
MKVVIASLRRDLHFRPGDCFTAFAMTSRPTCHREITKRSHVSTRDGFPPQRSSHYDNWLRKLVLGTPIVSYTAGSRALLRS